MKSVILTTLILVTLTQVSAQSTLTVDCNLGTTIQEHLDNKIAIDGTLIE